MKLQESVSLSRGQKCAAMGAFLGLLASNLSLLSNRSQVLDGLWRCQWDTQFAWDVSLGRWGRLPLYFIRSGVVSTVGILLLCCAAVMLAGALLEDIFRPDRPIVSALMGIAIGVSPQIFTMMLITFCADSYCISVAMAVAAAWFVLVPESKGRRRVAELAIAAVCLLLALSMYQTHVGITAILLLFGWYRMLMNGAEIKAVVRRVWQGSVVGIAGMIGYLISVHLTQIKDGVEMSEYSGADTVGIRTILQALPGSLWAPYHFLSEYCLYDNVIHNTLWGRKWIWLALCGIFAATQLCRLLEQKVFRDKIRLAAMALCLALVPMGAGLILIIVPQREMNLMMSGGIVFLLPGVLALSAEAIEQCPSARWNGVGKAAAVIAAIAMLWTQFWQVQASYMAIENSVNQAEMVAQDVYQRGTQLEGYSAESRWLFVGNTNDLAQTRSAPELYARAIGFLTDDGVFWNTNDGNMGTWQKFFEYYLGTKITATYESSNAELLNSEEYLKMPCYPEKGSVRMIGNIIVVKFQE